MNSTTASASANDVPSALPAPGPEFEVRWKRIMDCVALREPDRMPVGLFATFWFAKYGGISYRELMYDHAKAQAIIERACEELQPDLCMPIGLTVTFGAPLEAMGFKQLEWPGHGVGDNRPFQYVDREYMRADEYDEFLFDPTGYYLSKYLPRVCEAYEGLEPLAGLTGSAYVGTCLAAATFADPRIKAAVDRLSAASGVMLQHFGRHAEQLQRMTAAGFPMSFGSISGAPYDTIADFFRGATGMMKDLYRFKDKLPEVLDKMATLTIRNALAQAKLSTNPIVFMPLHWAPDAFMSQKQFETFWWPSFKKVMDALIENNLIPMPMWESDCTKRLEFLRENTPPGKCIYWFERTDMVRAHEVLGDVVALRGGLQGTLFLNGTPDDIDAEVRRLVENVCHKGGRLILDAAFGLPDETPIENARAMFAAARKYSN